MAFFANFTQFLTMLIITHKSVGIVATYTAYREVGCSVPASGKINMGPLKDFSNITRQTDFPASPESEWLGRCLERNTELPIKQAGMEQRLDDLCFEEDWLDQPLERDTELPTGAPVSKKALQKLFSKISTPPDISKGLGKHQEKRDIFQLEQFVANNLPLMMYEGELYLYEPPYWKKLSKREAKKKIRTLLEKECQIDYLTESKYQKILNLPIINSDISEERTLTSPRDKVNMLDGAYDLQTGELLPHDAEDYFFTCINVYGREMDMCREDTFEAFVRNCSDGDPVVRKQLLQLVALTILGKPLLLFAENHPIQIPHLAEEQALLNRSKGSMARKLGAIVGFA